MPPAKKIEAKSQNKKSGRFQKGVSGNPGGRPKTDPEVKAILKAAAPEAARLLVEMMYEDNPKIAMWAITDVLDRTQGKPVQAQDINMDVSGLLDVRTQVRSILLEQEQARQQLSEAQEIKQEDGRTGT
ncbi:MAG: hypothetical protein IJ587_05185 [Synergistaceae bacterium]|nr:hypothetical protein [Synergistaceae bacterium]